MLVSTFLLEYLMDCCCHPSWRQAVIWRGREARERKYCISPLASDRHRALTPRSSTSTHVPPLLSPRCGYCFARRSELYPSSDRFLTSYFVLPLHPPICALNTVLLRSYLSYKCTVQHLQSGRDNNVASFESRQMIRSRRTTRGECERGTDMLQCRTNQFPDHSPPLAIVAN